MFKRAIDSIKSRKNKNEPFKVIDGDIDSDTAEDNRIYNSMVSTYAKHGQLIDDLATDGPKRHAAMAQLSKYPGIAEIMLDVSELKRRNQKEFQTIVKAAEKFIAPAKLSVKQQPKPKAVAKPKKSSILFPLPASYTRAG
ncbi:MAG: hypothetical protein FWD15_03320 [Alphaproteobacteria bacterium]|nr:hypothetical protein [Alphaproteobacteria bacterium]